MMQEPRMNKKTQTIDSTPELAHWDASFRLRPCSSHGTYQDFEPAYAYAITSLSRAPARDFDKDETDLAEGWESARGRSDLPWEHAKEAESEAPDRLFHSNAAASPLIHDTSVLT
jgi:hypothetical protein